jgi:hydroxypyruvate isomerase
MQAALRQAGLAMLGLNTRMGVNGPLEICYRNLLGSIENLGYQGFIGAEYKPRRTAAHEFGWLNALR